MAIINFLVSGFSKIQGVGAIPQQLGAPGPAAPAQQVYPGYRKGIDLITLPDSEGLGLSDFTVKAIRAKYPNRPDILAGMVQYFKLDAVLLAKVSAGEKLTVAQFVKSSIAYDCVQHLVDKGTGQTTDLEGGGWDMDIMIGETGFPQFSDPDYSRISQEYSDLTAKMGAQSEKLKHKVMKLVPEDRSKACATSGFDIKSASVK